MTNEMKLQSAIKRKMVLRDTLGGTNGYKVKSCKVSRIDKEWYGFDIDGYYFECKWDNLCGKNYQTRIFFRNNKQLEDANYCYKYGIDSDMVKYASSLGFGRGTDLIRVLWVLGEVLDKKSSYEFQKL